MYVGNATSMSVDYSVGGGATKSLDADKFNPESLKRGDVVTFDVNGQPKASHRLRNEHVMVVLTEVGVGNPIVRMFYL